MPPPSTGTDEGKLYLCAIKDCLSTRIVGYSIADRMTVDLACSALRNAIALRNPDGTVVYSDRGSQFRSGMFVEFLSRNGLQVPMGRVGACGDNAAMESFFALLQRNVLDRRRWSSREDYGWRSSGGSRRRHQTQSDVDRRKTEALQSAGWKVVRIRETTPNRRPLPHVPGTIVSCTDSEDPTMVARRVVTALTTFCTHTTDLRLCSSTDLSTLR